MTGVLLTPSPTSLLKLQTIPACGFGDFFQIPKTFSFLFVHVTLVRARFFFLFFTFKLPNSYTATSYKNEVTQNSPTQPWLLWDH